MLRGLIPTGCQQACRLHDSARVARSITHVHLIMRAGLQQVALASCVCDTVLWQELKQLKYLQQLTLP